MLITGATGLLGRNIALLAAQKYELFGVARSFGAFPAGCIPIYLDLENRVATLRCANECLPDVIVHCAAMTDVDRCEAEADAARKLNVGASRTLAEWAATKGSLFVYISTDAVFDGGAGNYTEQDLPGPVNVYAQTKLEGEVAVRSANPSALVLRTNFYGRGGRRKQNLAEWILSELESGQRVRAFTDIRFNPLPASHLAKVILELIARGATGILHVGARNAVSKYECAVLLAELFGFDSKRVVPISAAEFPFIARRPKDTSLNVRMVSKLLGKEMLSVEDGLREFRKSFEDECESKLMKNLNTETENIQAH